MPGELEWSKIRPFLSTLRDIMQKQIAEHKTVPILCREQHEILPGICSSIDMIVGDTAWFFVPGDQAGEIRRLDRMVIAILSVLSTSAKRICMYQLITGIRIEWSIEDWSQESRRLLLAYIQARVEHNAG